MALPATDDFTGSNGVQLTTYNSDWTLNDGDLDIQANALAPDAASYNVAHWNADSFDDDQYAQVVIVAIPSTGNYIGPCVRCGGSGVETHYSFFSNSAQSLLFKRVTGSYTQLGSAGGAFAATELIRLEAEGTTITPLVDGTEEDPPGAQTDSSIASGSAGLGGFNDDPNYQMDDWEGGDLGAAPASSIPVFMHHYTKNLKS